MMVAQTRLSNCVELKSGHVPFEGGANRIS